jgi:hypothetical protein
LHVPISYSHSIKQCNQDNSAEISAGILTYSKDI